MFRQRKLLWIAIKSYQYLYYNKNRNSIETMQITMCLNLSESDFKICLNMVELTYLEFPKFECLITTQRKRTWPTHFFDDSVTFLIFCSSKLQMLG